MELTLDPTVNETSTLPFELDLLTRAKRYQKWVADTVQPYMGKRILEVGAGTGNMTQWLPLRESLVASEANGDLIPMLKQTMLDTHGSDARVHVDFTDLAHGGLDKLKRFDLDTVVSFNVLEHVENDLQALTDLMALLRASSATGPKRLISFVPAHQWAYGSIDQSYGHFRRYSRSDFERLAREMGFQGKIESRYFNAIGLPGWFVLNRVLKKKAIGHSAIESFEKICPYVRGLDDFVHEKLGLPLGQSLLVVMTL